MRGEIWWADVEDHQRPYLILQAEVLNEVAPTVIGLPVSVTRQQAGYPLTMPLSTDATGLAQDTWVRVTQPRTLRRSQLESSAAVLPAAIFDQILEAFLAVLGLTPSPGSHQG